jgi:hypothetical protein
MQFRYLCLSLFALACGPGGNASEAVFEEAEGARLATGQPAALPGAQRDYGTADELRAFVTALKEPKDGKPYTLPLQLGAYGVAVLTR